MKEAIFTILILAWLVEVLVVQVERSVVLVGKQYIVDRLLIILEAVGWGIREQVRESSADAMEWIQDIFLSFTVG